MQRSLSAKLRGASLFIFHNQAVWFYLGISKMITGFEKIVEERIRQSQKNGDFENLPGTGEPLLLEDNRHIPEDLRLAYKILKNADCIPPELAIKKEIVCTETLLEQMPDDQLKYKTLKKLNYLIMKLNTLRKSAIAFELPQKYEERVVDRLSFNHKGTPFDK